ncbi:hypothetical protein BH09DEP1_BH09DEP1_5850 [soil metagenome]
MTFLEQLQSKINNLDEYTWYKYVAVAAGLFLILIGLILFFYFSALKKWELRLNGINESRQEAKRLVEKAQRVYKARDEVTTILKEDPNFKIKEYLQEVMAHLGILQNVVSENVVVTGQDDNYSETVATYQLAGISMKQLTEFLNEIDENQRVFAKELDITKSKKMPRTIDVSIVIATLMPKE